MKVERAEERRSFTRVPFLESVQWNNASGDRGETKLRNFSRGGLRVSLSRYFRPGPVMNFRFDDIEFEGAPVSFDAVIAWCRPAVGAADRFDTGFRIVHEGPETLRAVSEVVYRALSEQSHMLAARLDMEPCGCAAS